MMTNGGLLPPGFGLICPLPFAAILPTCKQEMTNSEYAACDVENSPRWKINKILCIHMYIMTWDVRIDTPGVQGIYMISITNQLNQF